MGGQVRNWGPLVPAKCLAAKAPGCSIAAETFLVSPLFSSFFIFFWGGCFEEKQRCNQDFEGLPSLRQTHVTDPAEHRNSMGGLSDAQFNTASQTSQRK